MSKLQRSLDKMLDTFFHLPTLIVMAIIALAVLWQIYGIGLNLGNGFLRIDSKQGSITLHWADGCCEVNW